MTSGFAADAAAMAASADRLDEAADDTAFAARALEEGAGGDLGPADLGAAFEQVTGSLANTMRAAQADIAAAAEVARVASAAYLGVDEDAAGGLRGIAGRRSHG
jgi:hypothetical protein